MLGFGFSVGSSQESPFEPIERISLKLVTFKTLFLVAFATAARRSELHALSKLMTRDVDWSYVRLRMVDGFLAKNQTVKAGGNAFRTFEIKKLPTDGDDNDNDGFLCPVRALRCYDKRVIRGEESGKLFVSFVNGRRTPLHPNTVSSYLKSCIRLAYELSGKATPAGVKAHSVRSMSASWASLKNVALQSILNSCYWKSQNTFLSFYLKDLTEIEGEMYKLGKLSVSSTVI
jgi:hypothetical protein